MLDVFCSVFFWGGGWGEILLDTALVMYSKVAVFFISRILYSMPHLLTFSIFLSSVSVIWCTLLSSFAVYVDMAPAVIGSDMISLVLSVGFAPFKESLVVQRMVLCVLFREAP